MDAELIEMNLRTAIQERNDTERLIRGLCDEYRRTVQIPWLCLYAQYSARTGELQGLFWARLRRVRSRGQSTVFKDYIGTRLARSEMYKLGVLRWVSELEAFDKRAALLRERRKRVIGELDRVRKILRRHGKSRYGSRPTLSADSGGASI
jgi:hypothetical protein